MKKLLVVCFLLLSSLSIWSEDRIDIVLQVGVSGGIYKGIASTPNVPWVPYHNGVQITEPSLYSILGDNETALKAHQWKREKTILGWGGLGFVLVGCGLVAADILIDPNEATPGPLALSGFAAMGLGAPTLWIWDISLGYNFRPYIYIQHLADKYNFENK